MKFTILSDNGCTSSVSSDSILTCFTPSIIGSKNVNVVNFTGTSEIAVNKYRHEFIREQGSRFAAIDSVDKELFSQSTDWTQQELDRIFHYFRVPEWGKKKVAAPHGRKRVYMLLGTNHNELMAKEVKWSKIGGDPHFSLPNLAIMKSPLSNKYHITGTLGIDPQLFPETDGPSFRVSKRTYSHYLRYHRLYLKEE